MTRWKVCKGPGIFWDEDDELCAGPRWHVTTPTGVPWGDYATHAEAMAYADRESRTVKVTLPRPDLSNELETIVTTHKEVECDGYQHTTVVWREEPGTVGIDIGSADFFMLDHEAESVALALLAHARRAA